MKNLAIIPARSASKGLKDKNIKLLNGKPLLAYSIEAARESTLFAEIYVSTDSQKYADIAKEFGANIPFLRNSNTATDTASTWEVVKEALSSYRQIGQTFDMITLLQPTSPLRMGQDIMKAYQIFMENHANAVVSVCETDHSPLWCNTLPDNYSMTNFINKELSKIPRQALDTYYRINGAIYMVRNDYLNYCKDVYDSGCFAYIMDKERSIDIDDNFDFKLAQAIMNMKE